MVFYVSIVFLNFDRLRIFLFFGEQQFYPMYLMLIPVLLFLVFVGAIVFLIVRVYKKSTEKKSDSFLADEKVAMYTKLAPMQKKLLPWNVEFLKLLSNKMDFNFVKTTHRGFNGFINTADNEKVMAFRLIDRGLQRNCRIAGCTSSRVYFVEADMEQMNFEVNMKSLGSANSKNELLSANGEKWGQIRVGKNGSIALFHHEEYIASVKQNTERRTILLNPFSDYRYTGGSLESVIVWENEVEYDNEMVHLERELTDEESSWLMCITLFNLVFYGIDFTQ